MPRIVTVFASSRLLFSCLKGQSYPSIAKQPLGSRQLFCTHPLRIAPWSPGSERHTSRACAVRQLRRWVSLSAVMASSFNLDGKVFRSASNTANGEVSSATQFHYHQDSKLVWAEYGGGAIVKGFLIAIVRSDESLDARYEHVNTEGQLMTGKCRTMPERLPDGRLRLNESWQWTSGDQSAGESIVEEVPE